jgi:hypothetical protein
MDNKEFTCCDAVLGLRASSFNVMPLSHSNREPRTFDEVEIAGEIHIIF